MGRPLRGDVRGHKNDSRSRPRGGSRKNVPKKEIRIKTCKSECSRQDIRIQNEAVPDVTVLNAAKPDVHILNADEHDVVARKYKRKKINKWKRKNMEKKYHERKYKKMEMMAKDDYDGDDEDEGEVVVGGADEGEIVVGKEIGGLASEEKDEKLKSCEKFGGVGLIEGGLVVKAEQTDGDTEEEEEIFIRFLYINEEEIVCEEHAEEVFDEAVNNVNNGGDLYWLLEEGLTLMLILLLILLISFVVFSTDLSIMAKILTSLTMVLIALEAETLCLRIFRLSFWYGR